MVAENKLGLDQPDGLAVWLKDEQLKKARVRSNWANASVRVQAHPYLIFWQEYVCKKLYANGGKGAKRDRVAFENDFGVLHQ